MYITPFLTLTLSPSLDTVSLDMRLTMRFMKVYERACHED